MGLWKVYQPQSSIALLALGNSDKSQLIMACFPQGREHNLSTAEASLLAFRQGRKRVRPIPRLIQRIQITHPFSALGTSSGTRGQGPVPGLQEYEVCSRLKPFVIDIDVINLLGRGDVPQN
jgi:hypothetical protein